MSFWNIVIFITIRHKTSIQISRFLSTQVFSPQCEPSLFYNLKYIIVDFQVPKDIYLEKKLDS